MNARRGFITVIRYPSYLAETRIQKYKVAGRKSAFFKILIKNKEYISIKTLDRNTKASAAASPADLARRAWLRRMRDDGATTIRFRIFRRRGGGLVAQVRER